MSTLVEPTTEPVSGFPVTISLPAASSSFLEETAAAIRQEYRSSVRQKRLRCVSWEPVTEAASGAIYALHVGCVATFDWTWEGAIAYKPRLVAETDDDFDRLADGDDDENYWCGEVVEVDEVGGRIFVAISNLEQRPTTGAFFVRPFEFLALLNDVYHEDRFASIRQLLPSRLAAAQGGVYPQIDGAVCLGIPALQSMWEHAWGILWGPPGTGKTYSIGQQVAHCLLDPAERVLVVSTTNKATDGVALQIGKASRQLEKSSRSEGKFLRVGKGVNLEAFREQGLDDLVRGAETDLLLQVAELKAELAKSTSPETRAVLRDRIQTLLRAVRDVSRHAFLDLDIRVIVSTSFKASTMLWNPEFRDLIERGLAPFTTIVIDEAGLISRAAIAVLSLLASTRVILVGDPKQLAPISRMSRVLPTSEARWLASSGLSHLAQAGHSPEGVHLLTTQYRMHSDISDVISGFQYSGLLQTSDEVKVRSFETLRFFENNLGRPGMCSTKTGENFPRYERIADQAIEAGYDAGRVTSSGGSSPTPRFRRRRVFSCRRLSHRQGRSPHSSPSETISRGLPRRSTVSRARKPTSCCSTLSMREARAGRSRSGAGS